jgi:hypothetical protein
MDVYSPEPDARQPPPRPQPGTVVVTLPGELTFANAEQVKQDFAAAFGPGISTVIADGTPPQCSATPPECASWSSRTGTPPRPAPISGSPSRTTTCATA